MAKRILILCDSITPPLYQPRMVNLCRNLVSKRWEVALCTEKYPDTDFRFTACPFYQMTYYTHRDGQKKAWLSLLNYLFQYKDTKFKRYLQSSVDDIEHFDLILCSTFNLFPLTTALSLSRKYDIPLVADIRDLAEQWGGNVYFSTHSAHRHSVVNMLFSMLERINIRRRNRVLRQVDAVVTISPWHRAFLSAINPHTHLIYNGYDAEKFKPEAIRDDKFRIVYTGRLYSVKFRRPDLLLHAIQELDEEGIISPEKVSIDWYIGTDAQTDLDALIKHYGVEDYCHYHSYVPADEIPSLLNTASILLILTAPATESGPHGIMTTKFFEALGVEKPLLCVESDEECLAQTIRETNAGLSATSVEEVKAFIMEKYSEWQQNGYTRQMVDREKKPYFSRQYQATQFEEIFDSLSKTQNK